MENDPEKARRFLAENGFPWADACAAVRQALAQQFDDDARWLAERGLLEHATPWIRARAVEIGLIPTASAQTV